MRGGVGYAQALNTPFQGLADDGAGLGLFHLVRAGYRVVAFVHDEFLIEIPDVGGYVDRGEIDRAVGIARADMEEVLGGVPAACTWAVGHRWGRPATTPSSATGFPHRRDAGYRHPVGGVGGSVEVDGFAQEDRGWRS